MSTPRHDDSGPAKVPATRTGQTVAVAAFLGLLFLVGLVTWYLKFGQHG
jgi:hypothetical protein